MAGDNLVGFRGPAQHRDEEKEEGASELIIERAGVHRPVVLQRRRLQHAHIFPLPREEERRERGEDHPTSPDPASPPHAGASRSSAVLSSGG